MAGKLTKDIHATVTAATATGFVTVASATGLYVGALCWLSNTAGTVQDRVQITEITGTSVGVRKIPAMGAGPTYGRSDVSAYNAGGFLDQEAGLVYSPNDQPIP